MDSRDSRGLQETCDRRDLRIRDPTWRKKDPTWRKSDKVGKKVSLLVKKVFVRWTGLQQHAKCLACYTLLPVSVGKHLQTVGQQRARSLRDWMQTSSPPSPNQNQPTRMLWSNVGRRPLSTEDSPDCHCTPAPFCGERQGMRQ